MLVIQTRSLGNAVKCECEWFLKATLPMELQDTTYRVLLCKSKVRYVGGQMGKGED